MARTAVWSSNKIVAMLDHCRRISQHDFLSGLFGALGSALIMEQNLVQKMLPKCCLN